MVNGIDKIWAADLADMKAFEKDNDGYTFLLLVIDIFSKYGWIVPLKNKKGVSVAKALENIFQESNLRSYGRIKEQNFIIKMLKNY